MNLIFDEIDHSYTSEYGQIFVPVTSVISITPRAVDFSKLPRQDAIKKASLRGSMIHQEIEDFIKLGVDGISKTFLWFKQTLFPLFEQWECEVMVYSENEKTPYAGHIDLVCYNRTDGRWLIIDLKTGGHATVDYQTSLYKRALCKMRGIDPELVDLACIDASDEDKISFFKVRTIPASWLDELLDCYASGLPYIEPLPALTGVDRTVLANLSEVESYITLVEADLDRLKTEQASYKSQIYKAMESALVDSFEFGLLKITRVKPSTQTGFDKEQFKKDDPKAYEKYVTTIPKAGYLKITVRDITKESK